MFEMHQAINRNGNDHQLQVKYLSLIKNKDNAIHSTIHQLRGNILLNHSNNNNVDVDSYQTIDNTTNINSNRPKKRRKRNRSYHLEPNARLKTQQLILCMPDKSNRSYHHIMQQTGIPKPYLANMVHNIGQRHKGARKAYKPKNNNERKYWFLSGKPLLLEMKFDYNTIYQ
eukprot:422851_1